MCPRHSTTSAFGANRSSHSLVVIGWSVVGIVAEPAPVPLPLDGLVGNRPLDDQDERVELAPVGLEEPFDEIVRAADRTALEVDEGPVHGDLRQPGQGAQGDLLDARLGGRGQGHGVAVAAESGVDPENVDDRLVRRRPGCRQRWASPFMGQRPRAACSNGCSSHTPPDGPVNECLLHCRRRSRPRRVDTAEAWR